MKKEQIKTYIILIVILIITIFGIAMSLYIQQKPSTKNNLENIEYKGELIDDDYVLEDSGITGEEIVIDENDIYYTYLNEEEKKLYKQIYANILNLKQTFIPAVDLKLEDVLKVYQFVTYDNPEFFWLSNGFSYKYKKDNCLKQISLYFNGLQYEYEENKNKFENAANIILEEANKLETDYEKEKYVYDTLTKNVSYDKKAFYNQTAYSALVNHKTVCAGYSKAFQYIMKKLNIITYYVVGEVINEGHAWNIIKLSDGYYNVDLTWEEFNKTDNQISKTHTRVEYSKMLPACNATTYAANVTKEENNVKQDEKTNIKQEDKSNKESYVKEDLKNQNTTIKKDTTEVNTKENISVVNDTSSTNESNKVVKDSIADDPAYGNTEEVEEETIDETTSFRDFFFRRKKSNKVD